MKNSRGQFSTWFLREQGIDVNEWPLLNIDVLSEKSRGRTEARQGAMQSYLTQGATVRDVHRIYGVSSSTLFQMLANALRTHSDGEIVGYRAALLNLRINSYKREAPVGAQGTGGDSGVFSKLLDDYPQLTMTLREFAKRYKPREEGGPKRIVDYHQLFLKACRKAKIQEDQYPLSSKDQGLRSLERHLKKLAREIAQNKRAQLAERIEEEPKEIQVSEPLQEVQVDGHRIDLRLTVIETDQYGLEFTYEISVAWIILVIDKYTRCVLGYSIALGQNYDQTDFLKAIFRSIAPHEPPLAVIPGAKYKNNGGFPSQKIPSLSWSVGLLYKLDNALSQLAGDVRKKLANNLGCVVDYGPPHRPNKRAIVESFFNFLIDNFSHRLIGTKGSHPRDEIIKRLAPKGGDLRLLLTLDELHHGLDIVISDYNGRPHSGIAPHSPLSLFVQVAQQKRAFFNCLMRQHRSMHCFTNKVMPVKVLSDGGLSAYINFKQVRYRNLPALKNSVGVEVLIEWDPYDLSFLKVYDRMGDYLGEIFPPSPWTVPHSEKLRGRLMSAVKQGQIKFRSDSIADMLHDLQTTQSWGEREISTYNLKHMGTAKLAVTPKASPASPEIPIERLRGNFIIRGEENE